MLNNFGSRASKKIIQKPESFFSSFFFFVNLKINVKVEKFVDKVLGEITSIDEENVITVIVTARKVARENVF